MCFSFVPIYSTHGPFRTGFLQLRTRPCRAVSVRLFYLAPESGGSNEHEQGTKYAGYINNKTIGSDDSQTNSDKDTTRLYRNSISSEASTHIPILWWLTQHLNLMLLSRWGDISFTCPGQKLSCEWKWWTLLKTASSTSLDNLLRKEYLHASHPLGVHRSGVAFPPFWYLSLGWVPCRSCQSSAIPWESSAASNPHQNDRTTWPGARVCEERSSRWRGQGEHSAKLITEQSGTISAVSLIEVL